MSVEEIMVGDWVHYKMDLGKDGIFEEDIKINNIHGCDVNCKVIDYEMISGMRLSNCYPIPLTPKLLEKNGFKYHKTTDLWMWYEPSKRPVHLDMYTKKGWRLQINCNCIPCECKYVHQLQHALRLCGIEKEIEL